MAYQKLENYNNADNDTEWSKKLNELYHQKVYDLLKDSWKESSIDTQKHVNKFPYVSIADDPPEIIGEGGLRFRNETELRKQYPYVFKLSEKEILQQMNISKLSTNEYILFCYEYNNIQTYIANKSKRDYDNIAFKKKHDYDTVSKRYNDLYAQYKKVEEFKRECKNLDISGVIGQEYTNFLIEEKRLVVIPFNFAKSATDQLRLIIKTYLKLDESATPESLSEKIKITENGWEIRCDRTDILVAIKLACA